MSALTLGDLIRQTTRRLDAAGIDNPDFDTRFLINHILKSNRAEMLSQQARVLTSHERDQIEKIITRRVAREPVARIIGEREFWGLTFGLNEATLEPRPDSETLIEAAMKILPHNRPLRILDLGTGSGCLLLALLHERGQSTGLGIEVAQRAVDQAALNAKNLGLATRVEFRTGDWLDGLDGTFDLIISNPPYIKRDDIAGLMPEVRDHDPLLALDGGADGLDVYRLLIPRLGTFLTETGTVMFEVGQTQAEDVALMLHQAGFKSITTRQDLGGVERCVFGAAAYIP